MKIDFFWQESPLIWPRSFFFGNPSNIYVLDEHVGEGLCLKGLPEERAIVFAHYIIDHNTTVRATAKEFKISKSTVHTDVIK